MSSDLKLKISLLSMRATIFLVMALWTMEKLFNTEHAIEIYDYFYLIPIPSDSIMHVIAGLESVVLIGFGLGVKKTITYGLVLLFHTVSTISSYAQYLSLNLLFFTAWPMLAACFTLYLFRASDSLLTFQRDKKFFIGL